MTVRRREQDADKPDYARLYNCARWKSTSRYYRAAHPLCVLCGNLGEVVDHIEPHRGDVALFWRNDNWQTLCADCHNRKSARERTTSQDRPSA